jgi:hypothetical protein
VSEERPLEMSGSKNTGVNLQQEFSLMPASQYKGRRRLLLALLGTGRGLVALGLLDSLLGLGSLAILLALDSFRDRLPETARLVRALRVERPDYFGQDGQVRHVD